MALKLGEILIGIFKSKYIAVLFVSMFPLIELKGAIPIGMSEAFGLNLFETAAVAYLGSTAISVALFFLLIPIFNLLKKIKLIKRLVEKIESMFKAKAEKVAASASGSAEKEARLIKMRSLFIFVAVPFPITGVWTGTAIAVFLGMKFKESVLPIALGNLVAGSIITLLTYFFKDYVDYIIYALLALAAVMLAIFIVKIAISKPKEN